MVSNYYYDLPDDLRLLIVKEAFLKEFTSSPRVLKRFLHCEVWGLEKFHKLKVRSRTGYAVTHNIP